MLYTTVISPQRKSISLVAHDNMKKDLLQWCKSFEEKLSMHELYATGTTGTLLANNTGLNINKLISGPLGGD